MKLKKYNVEGYILLLLSIKMEVDLSDHLILHYLLNYYAVINEKLGWPTKIMMMQWKTVVEAIQLV